MYPKFSFLHFQGGKNLYTKVKHFYQLENLFSKKRKHNNCCITEDFCILSKKKYLCLTNSI